jgi:hypothetical protein
MTKTNIDITQTLETIMAKKLGAISRDGCKVTLHSGEEIFICISVKKPAAYLTDPKTAEELGRWFTQAAIAMKKEKRKRNKK